jgi:predicted ATP-dependent serine protease
MSIATLILGDSGRGKSRSLLNLDPAKTFLVQCIAKPLPFKAASKGWVIRNGKSKGNILQTSDPETIMNFMRKSPYEVFVIDDFQQLLVNQLMARSSEKGYDKFTDLAKSVWNIFNLAGTLDGNKRVYIMTHTQTDEFGNVRMKTVGKMVDQTLVPEGFFTVVLRALIVNDQYIFSTKSNGLDCVKTPEGMFDQEHIENDLSIVDAAISTYFSA